MRESPYIRSLAWQAPAALGIAVVLAVIGPFGTYFRMSLGDRLAYFLVIGVLNWLQVVFLAAWFGQVEPIDRWPVIGRMILVGLIASVPCTLEVFLVLRWMGYPIPFAVVPYMYPENALLTTSIGIVFGLFVEQRMRAQADAEMERVASLPQRDAPAATPPDFFRRIPPALGRDLLALEMEDHYLRIHTALGSDLVLMRLRDALAELGPSRGRQVHRSWWVAEGALAKAERADGRLVLVLRNGLSVPVSKTYRNQVKQAGWLEA
jgi:DNA-binding LytR/AlgR family response regulator